MTFSVSEAVGPDASWQVGSFSLLVKQLKEGKTSQRKVKMM